MPVTAKLMATLLEAAGVDHVLTCDLHNPAIQAYFNIICDRVTAKHLLEKYFQEKQIKDMVVVATDAGSSKKAYKYSKFFECPLALIDKRRESNNDNAVATNILKEHGAKEIYAGATHGVLVGPAIERIEKSPIKELVVTNTIPIEPEKRIDKIKVVSIAPLFAEAIKRLNEAKPLGDLFEYDK